jgi:hypothetical protein
MALHPVGPLPASTYWRRRLVLIVLLVAVLLVLRSCTAGGSTRHPSPASSPHPTSTPAGQHAAAASPTSSPTPPVIGPCPDSALTLTVATDAATYKVGGTPRITMTVTNTSGGPCTRDLGGDAVQLLVFSGSDRIWANTDCSHDSSRNVMTLQARQVLQTTVLWSGHRSAPGCPTPQAAALPGTYTARGILGTLSSTFAVFTLHA